ncbi:unnamed protein product, partial [Choristocarpus tenellus]
SQELSENPPSAAFVATLGRQVVGVVVAERELCTTDRIHCFRSKYRTEDFVAFDRHRQRNQAVLTALALNPIFFGHCRFVLKEVMRLYDKAVVFWESPSSSDLPSSVPWHMVPVRPRRCMQPQPEENDIFEGREDGWKMRGIGRERSEHEWLALYFLSRRFITEPKITANR